jgi:hypothetical protein
MQVSFLTAVRNYSPTYANKEILFSEDMIHLNEINSYLFAWKLFQEDFVYSFISCIRLVLGFVIAHVSPFTFRQSPVFMALSFALKSVYFLEVFRSNKGT